MDLQVPYIDCDSNASLQEVSEIMNGLQRHPIDRVSWPSYPYAPDASFSIAWTDNALWLKYFVKENSVRACCQTDNSPVYEDSCVEFFISFDDAGYYNLEFNCIGVCLAAFGKSRFDRQSIPQSSMSQIRRMAQVENFSEEGVKQASWQLALVIPTNIFVHHTVAQLKGRSCRVNFYKCGDELPQPHYLSWMPIKADNPDFHLPDYFGQMQFV